MKKLSFFNFKSGEQNLILTLLESSTGEVVASIEADAQHIGQFYPEDLSGRRTRVPAVGHSKLFLEICERRVRRMLRHRHTFFRRMVGKNKSLQFI
ncbi:MAG: hypothetical protein IJ099_01740 [Alphaproteobacteria bacterium]|nr:hypothetical protein [Alphaproteobacteria bacterium]